MFTTTVFSQCSSGWFRASPRRAALEDQQTSISRTAPRPMNCHRPPSAFVFTTRRSSTAPYSPESSPASAGPASSAAFSSPTTTPGTAIPGSACTPRSPSTTAPGGKSAPAASGSSTPPTPPAPTASAGHPEHPNCHAKPGSTSHDRPSSHRRTQQPTFTSPDVPSGLTGSGPADMSSELLPVAGLVRHASVDLSTLLTLVSDDDSDMRQAAARAPADREGTQAADAMDALRWRG
jgi:hypothetical protein